MNTSLTRLQFVDRTISPDDLQWIATMLADWHHRIHRHLPSLTVTLNLWGCPKQEGETLFQQVQERAAAMGIPLTGVPLTPQPGEWAPRIGSLMDMFQDPALQNLVAEIRLKIGDNSLRTLVLYGSVQNGNFLLKSLWTVGMGAFQDEVYSHGAWSYEAKFFNALADYKNGNRAVPAWSRDALFPDPANRPWLNGLAWFLSPQYKNRLTGFLLRAAIAGVLLAVSVWGAIVSLHSAPSLSILPILGVIISGLGLVYTLGMKTVMIFTALNRMRANLESSYSQAIRYPEVNLADAPAALQDPAVRKVSAELAALGGQHYKDIIVQPPLAGESWIRLYVFPEEATVFAAMFMHKTSKYSVFPSKPTFLLRTYLSDGYRLVSTSAGTGYRKPLPLPVIARTFPDVNDPAEMLQKHRAALVQAELTGRTRVPIEPERIIEQMIAEHEESGEALAKYGYFHLDDAVRMVFHLPRSHYGA